MLDVLAVPLLVAMQVAAVEPTRARPDPSCAAIDTTTPQPAACRARDRAATPEDVATAFESVSARTLLARARVARFEQDSALRSYDAVARQRMTVKLAVTSLGRERLVFRHENASRVRWHRGEGGGVLIDVLGDRAVVPIAEGAKGDVEADVDAHGSTAIPYFPGRETLWMGYGLAKPAIDEDELIHPIAAGAEAYYRYSIGDSIGIQLPSGRTIRLVELRVRARQPRWNLVVGSFWFDASSAQLVRAAYRMAVPLDAWTVIEEEGDDEDIPVAVRALITPLTGSIDAVAIEYGLYEGRFWLPRTQAAYGHARAGFMRIPFSLEQNFRYTSVNGAIDAIGVRELATSMPAAPTDSTITVQGFDSDTIAEDRGRRGRSRRRGRTYVARCATEDTLVYLERRFEGTLPVRIRIPCDSVKLATSSELPPSIYDPGDHLFGRAERDELLKSLDLSTQPAWAPQRPELIYGLDRNLLRYNRIEGLSVGAGIRQVLGRGYTAELLAQVGVADLRPNAEARIWRGDGRRTIGLAVYHRLTAANDWGDPLALGNSVNALLFARDEGFYYRAWGAELTGVSEASSLAWRLFAERQREAEVETQFSFAHALNAVRFVDNIDAGTGSVAGIALRWTHAYGDDPRRLRLFVETRAEGAVGDFEYVRGAADVTVSRQIAGRISGAVTGGAGSTAGDVPAQRLWYLGGAHTIRGQRAEPGPLDAPGVGNAYWMARAEIASGFLAARPVLFYDLGWAGDRAQWSHPGQPMSGAGIGASFFDGLVRLDLARGIHPREEWRLALYLEGRF